MKKHFLGTLFWVLLSFFSLVTAQPVEQALGKTVADTEHDNYRFEVLTFTSADGERHYRVTLAIPKAVPPANGFPVFYMLDGNAALATLVDKNLITLAKAPKVLVFIAHDNGKDFDFTARAYDYTPPTDGIAEDALDSERKNGGADAYFSLIQDDIMTAVNQLTTIDETRQTLWGHSYGGLFVLYALYTKPLIFEHYIASAPSLWWGGSRILQLAEGFTSPPDNNIKVTIETSAKKKERLPTENLTAKHQARLDKRKQMFASLPKDAAQNIVNTLQSLGINATLADYPNLSHGELLPFSIRQNLHLPAN